MSMSAKTVVPDIETCRPSVAKEGARVLSRRVWLSCHKSFSLHRTSDVKLKHIMHIEADDFFDFLLWVKQVDWHGIYWASCWFCAELRKAVHVSKQPHGAARSQQQKNGQSRRVNTSQISQFATKTSNNLHRRLHTWVKTRMVFRYDIYIYMFFLSIYLSIYPSIHLSIYLSIYLIYLYIWYTIYIYPKPLRRHRYDAFATPWQLAFGELQGLAEADGTKWQVWSRLIKCVWQDDASLNVQACF